MSSSTNVNTSVISPNPADSCGITQNNVEMANLDLIPSHSSESWNRLNNDQKLTEIFSSMSILNNNFISMQHSFRSFSISLNNLSHAFTKLKTELKAELNAVSNTVETNMERLVLLEDKIVKHATAIGEVEEDLEVLRDEFDNVRESMENTTFSSDSLLISGIPVSSALNSSNFVQNTLKILDPQLNTSNILEIRDLNAQKESQTLNSTKTMIVRLISASYRAHLLKKKKSHGNVMTKDVDPNCLSNLPVYINDLLPSNVYKHYVKTRKFFARSKVHKVFTYEGRVFVRKGSEKPFVVNLNADLDTLFPNL